MGAAEREQQQQVPVEQKWLTTADAAVYTGMSVNALQKAVLRGHLRPDAPARKGWTRCHRFLRETLDAFVRGDRAAG